MFAFAILCINVNRDAALPFVLSEAGALSVTAIAFGDEAGKKLGKG